MLVTRVTRSVSASPLARRTRATLLVAVLSLWGGYSSFAKEATEAKQPTPEPTKKVAAESAKKQSPSRPTEAVVAKPAILQAEDQSHSAARLIGATTVVTVVNCGLPLPARVDTGATSCSIHCDALEIKDPAEDGKLNIGKPVRFLIKNGGGDAEGQWLEAKIVDHVTVRTSESEDERYKVQLKLRWEDVEKKVLVTLNDRQNMKYPVLLGRNFLRDDFLVNVSLDENK